MLDPLPPSPWLRDVVEPFTRKLHLYTLTLHLHEVLFSYFAYVVVNSVVAPRLSARLLPATYAQFPPRTKLQWNLHVTSFVNATFLSIAVPYLLYADKDRLNATWEERLWGYTGAGGLVQALGAGYFLWDVQVSSTNVNTLGLLNLLHAVVGLCVSILGFVRSRSASRQVAFVLIGSRSALLDCIMVFSMDSSSSPPPLSTSTGFSTRQALPDRNYRWSTASSSLSRSRAAVCFGAPT